MMNAEGQQAGAQTAAESFSYSFLSTPHTQRPLLAQVRQQCVEQAALIGMEGYGFEVFAAVM